MDKNKYIDDLINAGASDNEIQDALKMATNRGDFGAQPEKGLLDKIGESFKKRVGNVTNTALNPDRNKVETALAVAGQGVALRDDIAGNVLTSAFPVTSNLVKTGLGKIVSGLSNTGAGQASMSKISGFAKEHPEAMENITNALNLAGVLPFVKIASKGFEGLEAAGKGLQKIPIKEISEIAPELQTANKAATDIGYTLSKGMEQSPLGKTVGGGKWSELETGLLQNMPFSRKLFGALKEKNYSVAKGEIDKIQASIPNVSDDALKAKLQGEVDKANDIISTLYKPSTEASTAIYVDTKGLTDKLKKQTGLFDEAGTLKTTYTGIPENELNKIQSLVSGAENLEVKKGELGGGENFSSLVQLRKDVGGELSRMRSIKSNAMNQASSGVNSSTAGRLEGVYSGLYKKLSQIEEEHIGNVEKTTGQEGLLDTYKQAKELFREDRPIQNIINKIVGTGEEVTDKGFKSSDKAVSTLLDPKETERFNAVWEYVDDPTKEAIRGKLLSNIINPAKTTRIIDGVENTVDLSINRLGKEWNKYRQSYGNDNLVKIFGKDAVDKMDNFIIGSERARIDRVSLYNEGNPSGTGSATMTGDIIKSALTGGVGAVAATATGNMMLSPLSLALTPAILYGTRIASKIATKTPLNGFEKLVSGDLNIGNRLKSGLGSILEKTGNLANKEVAPEMTAKIASLPESALQRLSTLGNKGELDLSGKTYGLVPAIKSPETGKIYTGSGMTGHKGILNQQISRQEPNAEKAVWNELFKDNTGEYSPYVGFVDTKGNFIPRLEAEQQLSKPKSLAQLFHDQSGYLDLSGKETTYRDDIEAMRRAKAADMRWSGESSHDYGPSIPSTTPAVAVPQTVRSVVRGAIPALVPLGIASGLGIGGLTAAEIYKRKKEGAK